MGFFGFFTNINKDVLVLINFVFYHELRVFFNELDQRVILKD